MQPNHCSATRIRQQLKNAQPVDGCLAQPVLNFILQNRLYES
jgi:nicotinic acid mononucleotide adenylyltransferase